MNIQKQHTPRIFAARESLRSAFSLTRRMLLLFFSLAIVYTGMGQDVQDSTLAKNDTTLWNVIYSDAEIVVEDGLCFFTEPARFTTGDWIFAGTLFASTMATMTQDAELRKIRLRNRAVSDDVQALADFGTEYGNIFDASVAAGAVYLTGLLMDVYDDGGWFERGELRKLARLVGESLFFSGSIAAVMRSVLGRKRPYNFKPGQEDIWDYELFNMKTSKNSFPSGHIVVTMAMSTTLAEYIDTWLARAIIYPFAALGLYSRLESDGHWTSDIVFGAGLGISTGIYMAARQKRRDECESKGSALNSEQHVILYPVPGGMGLIVRF